MPNYNAVGYKAIKSAMKQNEKEALKSVQYYQKYYKTHKGYKGSTYGRGGLYDPSWVYGPGRGIMKALERLEKRGVIFYNKRVPGWLRGYSTKNWKVGK
jgi:hypothetical protein